LIIAPEPQQTAFAWKNIVAFFALGVSLFTLYWTVFRRGRLRVRLGRVMLVQYVPNGKTHFKPEISVINTGATTVLIYNISGWVRRMSDDRKENLVWIENLTTEFVPESRSTDTRFQSFPDTITVGKPDAIKQRLLLATEHPCDLQVGDYEMKLLIDCDGAARTQAVVESKIRIRPDDIEFLENARPAPDAKIGRNLRFTMEYGPNTNCYLALPQRPPKSPSDVLRTT
jgi:hypothetical protein